MQNTAKTEAFLNQLAAGAEQKEITIYLVNGIKLVGEYKGHDDAGIIMSSNSSTEQLVMRSAVSTVVPNGGKKGNK